MNTPPVSFNLYQNYPNSFNPVTIIRYAVPKSASVTLTIYDVLGKLVGKPVNETKTAGYYQVEFDGSNLANGVYFYTLVSDNVSMTKKMWLLK